MQKKNLMKERKLSVINDFMRRNKMTQQTEVEEVAVPKPVLGFK